MQPNYTVMTVAVLADEMLKQEINDRGAGPDVRMIWADSLRSLTIIEADVYMDLLFDMDRERISRLQQLLPKPVIVNAVAHTTREIGLDVIRINAWPGMLRRPLVEIVLPENVEENNVATIFNTLQWTYQAVPDVPGMITARVLAMIINEAYYTWGSGVSSREEIDTAMKLGTNYPLGPFEWSERIGVHRVRELLHVLSHIDKRYTPHERLLNS